MRPFSLKKNYLKHIKLNLAKNLFLFIKNRLMLSSHLHIEGKGLSIGCTFFLRNSVSICIDLTQY